MIKNALQMLVGQADRSVEELGKIRTQITDAFNQDYVISPSTMERLLQAQKAVSHWVKVKRVIARATTEEEQVAGLEQWISNTQEQLLECGRSRSTSLVVSAEHEADEDELKQVLRHVKQFVNHARSTS